MYVLVDASDRLEFIRHLAHSKPNLRILELSAGTCRLTADAYPTAHALQIHFYRYLIKLLRGGKEKFQG